MAIHGVDVAVYQGRPNWSKVYTSGIRFAFSKATEGTTYTNPTWAHNRKGMLALDGFLPGAYHFLRIGNGAAQARHFLARVGDVSRLAVALDVEPHPGVAGGPGADDARAWVAEFKQRTNGHPVIGYYPRWYWNQSGRPDLGFFDALWQSHYVSGSGSPRSLFPRVTSDMWTPFGGKSVTILQFSSRGRVPGISGDVDLNAYQGTLSQLRDLALGEEMPTPQEFADAVWEKTMVDRRGDDKPHRMDEYLYGSYNHLRSGLNFHADAIARKDIDLPEEMSSAALFFQETARLARVAAEQSRIAAEKPTVEIDAQAVASALAPHMADALDLDALAQKVADVIANRMTS